jgi:hypothetical protein
MESYNIAMFGEAERGDYSTIYFCQTLPQLVDYFGNPPPDSRGLFLAVQAILYNRHLFFLRVQEEGFSIRDYLKGLQLLKTGDLFSKIAAIAIPGVGDVEIIDAIAPLCLAHHSILITTEDDLYDYLTSLKDE